MPKMKTNSGALKRFKRTGSGKLKRRHAGRAHIKTKQTNKKVRQARHMSEVGESDRNSVERMLKAK